MTMILFGNCVWRSMFFSLLLQSNRREVPVVSGIYPLQYVPAGCRIQDTQRVFIYSIYLFYPLACRNYTRYECTACHNSIILSREVGSVPTHVSFRVTLRALLLNTYKHITHKKMPARIVPGYRTTAVLPDYSFKKARMCQAYLCTFKSGVLRINSNSRYRNTHARTPPMSSGDFRG